MSAPVPRRNDPCPCGSGKKYKLCCGRLAEPESGPSPSPRYPGWEKLTAVEQGELWQSMQDALAAQHAGRVEDARRLYRSVLQRAPQTFDALHMLGVIEYQLNHLDEAEDLILRAMTWLAAVKDAQNNLELVRAKKRAVNSISAQRTVAAQDMIASYVAALRAVSATAPAANRITSISGGAGILHIVAPGDVLNPRALRSGSKI